MRETEHNTMDGIQVTAAIIQQEGKILICQRAYGGNCSYLWEFPGGKLEVGETLEGCVIRECKEELGLTIKVTDVFAETTHFYGEKKMIFTFFNVGIVSGEIIRKVHQDIRWVPAEELEYYSFCPADVDIAERLRSR